MKTNEIWLITGATSIIAEKFAHRVASQGCDLILLGRNEAQMATISRDLMIRYKINCEIFIHDFSQDTQLLINKMITLTKPYKLFIGHARMDINAKLESSSIKALLDTNVLSTVQIIHHYWNTQKEERGIIFISSVAAAIGRCKNSLYGASKAAIDLYLQGLQQEAHSSDSILIARAGFIDTRQTWGVPGMFYKASPEAFAKRLLKAFKRKRHTIYYPRFWRFIMVIFYCTPWGIYRKMKRL